MNRVREFLLVGLGCLTLLPCVHAELAPQPGTVDARVRTALFEPEQVYRIAGAVGYQIHIEFEAGETFVGLAAGDIEGLGVSTVENNLFLKPKAPSVGTNLTVVTNRRRYQFDYTATSRRAGNEDALYALRFTYPPPPAQPPVDRVEQQLATSDERPMNLHYGYCGDPSLKPLEAYDDGVHTWLKFGGHAEWPAVFVRGEDGSESLVNFSVHDDELVLHRIARRIVLRRGKLVGCVVNQAFLGAADRVSTGTTSPAVRREMKGERHE